jgi:hypothetical protein
MKFVNEKILSMNERDSVTTDITKQGIFSNSKIHNSFSNESDEATAIFPHAKR